MTLDEVMSEVTGQSFGLLTDADAVMALLAHGGIAPEDVLRVELTFKGSGFDIAFHVIDPEADVIDLGA